LLAVAKDWKTLWKQGTVSRSALVLTTGAVVWPWLACLGLGVAWLTVSRLLAQEGWWLPLYTSAKLPTPLVGLFPLGLLLSLAWRREASTHQAVEALHSET